MTYSKNKWIIAVFSLVGIPTVIMIGYCIHLVNDQINRCESISKNRITWMAERIKVELSNPKNELPFSDLIEKVNPKGKDYRLIQGKYKDGEWWLWFYSNHFLDGRSCFYDKNGVFHWLNKDSLSENEFLNGLILSE